MLIYLTGLDFLSRKSVFLSLSNRKTHDIYRKYSSRLSTLTCLKTF